MMDGWRVESKPDPHYGMSYPYVLVYLNDKPVLEKFPFSPYFGRIGDFSITILSMSATNLEREYCINIWHGNKHQDYKRGFSTLEEVYQYAIDKTKEL